MWHREAAVQGLAAAQFNLAAILAGAVRAGPEAVRVPPRSGAAARYALGDLSGKCGHGENILLIRPIGRPCA